MGILPVTLESDREQGPFYFKIGQTRRPDQLKELYFLAGVLCGLLSEVSLDLGYPEAAGNNALAAWAYGNAIGNGSLGVWARGMQSTWTPTLTVATNTSSRRLSPSGPHFSVPSSIA